MESKSLLSGLADLKEAACLCISRVSAGWGTDWLAPLEPAVCAMALPFGFLPDFGQGVSQKCLLLP